MAQQLTNPLHPKPELSLLSTSETNQLRHGHQRGVDYDSNTDIDCASATLYITLSILKIEKNRILSQNKKNIHLYI